MKIINFLTLASVALLFASCGGGYVRPEDRPSSKAAEAEVNRLTTISRQAEKEYYQAQQSGDNDRIEKARVKKEEYCDKANKAIREYYDVLDYEYDKSKDM